MDRLSFRQIRIGEQMVGLWGLKELFDELRAQGRAPDLAPCRRPVQLSGRLRCLRQGV